MSSDVRKEVSKQIRNTRAARKKSREQARETCRRGKGKRCAWHGRKRSRHGGPCRTEGAEAPCFSCGPSYTYKKISGGTGYGMVSIRFSGNIRNGSSGISPVCIARASRRSQFAPVIILQIEAGLPPHSFRGNFPRRQPQGKLPRKECGKCGWQDRFGFPLMEGETVLHVIRSFQTCSLVIPYMPIFL